MARAFSMDLRRRVVSAVGAGESRRSAARRYGVSPSAAVKWLIRVRESGSPAAKRMGGYRRPALAGERDWLLAWIKEKPDLTIRALAAELVDRGVKAGPYAVWSFLKREGLSFKQNSARQRAGSPGRGAQARTMAAISGAD